MNHRLEIAITDKTILSTLTRLFFLGGLFGILV